MSTINKALDVLGLFSEVRPAVGLSEAARLLNRDKATTQRHLSALQAQGFLEQDPLTRAWHLGPAVTRLAIVRDKSWPVETSVRNIVTKLVKDTGETCHVSHAAGTALHNVLIVETSVRGTRVYVDPSDTLPLHATGSGIAFLAAAPDPAGLLDQTLPRFTEATPVAVSEVLNRVEQARARGYSKSVGTFETDVVGLAAAVFGRHDHPVGAVAVALPTSRFDTQVEADIAPLLRAAAQDISRVYGAQTAVLRAAE